MVPFVNWRVFRLDVQLQDGSVIRSAYGCGERLRFTGETLAILNVFIFMRSCGFLVRGLRDRLLSRAFGGMETNGSGSLYMFFLLDGSEVALRVQCLKR